ncbi:MAPEG family protein [Phenylobacterium sp. LjRoot225]|uniref:MAPEG family protein n=1 Tax=Phenylobacterium sp. LjRoot225 TaxID=3342285 RepID=UPI003ECC421A
MTEPFAAYWILLVGALMPYVLVFIAKANRDYDNADPRNPAALTTPFRRSAYGAHLNSLEAFPLFAAAVLLAGLRRAPAEAVDLAAWLWLAFRLAYAACYLTGRPSLRSLSWLGATACSLAILVMALTHGAGAPS